MYLEITFPLLVFATRNSQNTQLGQWFKSAVMLRASRNEGSSQVPNVLSPGGTSHSHDGLLSALPADTTNGRLTQDGLDRILGRFHPCKLAI